METLMTLMYYGAPLLSIAASIWYIKYRRETSGGREGLVIFTRYPLPGKAKTRLIPAVGEDGAATAQRLMTESLVRRLTKHNRSVNPELAITVAYYGGEKRQMVNWLGRLWNDSPSMKFVPQTTSGDLGHKMATAFKEQFSQGKSSAVIVGCDIPGITGELVEETLSKLRDGDTDMVLGPAEDGGYYLVGLRRETCDKLNELFSGNDIEWSTENVFTQQKQVAAKLGLKLHSLGAPLSDVDNIDDLPELEKQLKIRKADLVNPQWSVVVPVLNEVKNVERVLSNIKKSFSDLTKLQEVIFCDGGSQDGTVQAIENLSKNQPFAIKIANCNKGRGTQLREGMREVSGFYIMVFHVDSLLPSDFDIPAEQALKKHENVAGVFTLGFDKIDIPENRKTADSFAWAFYNTIKFGAKWRSKLAGLPFGDQGLFLTRPNYDACGGYPDWPLFEDVCIVRKLAKLGRIQMIDKTMITSSRRWEKNGYIKTTAMINFYLWMYNVGVSPQTIARWYYRKR